MTPIEHAAPPSMARDSLNLPAYNAGIATATLRAVYGIEKPIRMCSNENPLGPGKLAMAAAKDALSNASEYPDSAADALRRAIAERTKSAPECVIVGNGSEELIVVAYRALLNPGDEVVTTRPSFGLHTIHATALGCQAHTVAFASGMAFDVPAILSAVGSRTRLVAISSPSNPVGVALDKSQLETLATSLPSTAVLMLDEAYYEYAALTQGYPDTLDIFRRSGVHYIVLRTFSKAYGLAGLRVGYAIASHPLLVQVMDRIRTPFNTSRIAQAAALAALDDTEHLSRSITLVAEQRRLMEHGLQTLGVSYAPSQANFLFVDTGIESVVAAEALLRSDIVVKPWREPGFTTWFRVTVSDEQANRAFLQAMRNLVEINRT